MLETEALTVRGSSACAISSPPVVSGNTANILSLIDAGMRSGQSAEAIGQLVSLLDRAMAKDAEMQFVEAKRAFQAECPVIGKNKDVAVTGGPKYRYADLEKITTTIRPLLEKHGFSYDFAQTYDKEVVKVICFLRHKAGHVQATEFSGPWATNAGMSAIQKSASATTFCQRYALRMALGLPVGEDDDCPPPPHDNAPADENAPNPRSRDQRTGVTSGTLKALSKEWADSHGNGKFSAEYFQRWVRKCAKADGIELPDGFAWQKPEEWTNELVAACRKDLP